MGGRRGLAGSRWPQVGASRWWVLDCRGGRRENVWPPVGRRAAACGRASVGAVCGGLAAGGGPTGDIGSQVGVAAGVWAVGVGPVTGGCRWWSGRGLAGGRLCRVGPQWDGVPRSAPLPCAAPVHAGASFVRPAPPPRGGSFAARPLSRPSSLRCASSRRRSSCASRPPPPGALSLPAPFRAPLPCAAPAHAGAPLARPVRLLPALLLRVPSASSRRSFRAASFLPPGPFFLAGVCAVPDRNGAGRPAPAAAAPGFLPK